jgi:hypothetical protein
MEEGTRPHWRLDGMAESRSACRAEGTGDRDRVRERLIGEPYGEGSVLKERK